MLMLAGGDFEPSPENFTGITRSFDHGKSWTRLEQVDLGLPRDGETKGQGQPSL